MSKGIHQGKVSDLLHAEVHLPHVHYLEVGAAHRQLLLFHPSLCPVPWASLKFERTLTANPIPSVWGPSLSTYLLSLRAVHGASGPRPVSSRPHLSTPLSTTAPALP